MAQQHKRVQVFRARQEQKPQQEQKLSRFEELAQQAAAKWQQEDPEGYAHFLAGSMSRSGENDWSPPCIDPDWDPAEMETSET